MAFTYKDFQHLHFHSSMSLLDSANRPSDSAKLAKELGFTHLAVTDHNHLAATAEWGDACAKQDIIGVLGVEMYYTHDMDVLSRSADDRWVWATEQAKADGVTIPTEIISYTKTGKERRTEVKVKDIRELVKDYVYDTQQYHVILIALNQNGWKNLVGLQSEAASRCTFNGRFLCDDALLAKYSDDLVCTTACIGSYPAQLIMDGRPEEALAVVQRWSEIFKDRFYLEIQPLNKPEQWGVNLCYMDWSKTYGYPLVATTDVHYLLESDHDDHDTLVCVSIGMSKHAPERKMSYDNEYWLKSVDDMVRTFERQLTSMQNDMEPGLVHEESYRNHYRQAMANTRQAIDTVQPIRVGSDVPMFPQISPPGGMTSPDWLTLLCWQKLYAYLKLHPEYSRRTYENRLHQELGVIISKGFDPYILIVEEYVRWANANFCPTGPGRGSAAGSLALFVLGITHQIDPIQHKLLFSRFLTEDRTAVPDIDTDFDYDNRESVIRHLEDIYGKENVAHIGSFSYIKVKSGIKDFGRVIGVGFDECNAINKKLDELIDDPETTFEKYDNLKDFAQDYSRWLEFHALEEKHPELFRLARRFEGTPRQMSVHASGVLVTPQPVTNLIPTRMTADGTLVTLYQGAKRTGIDTPGLEELNYIKFDILGLKTISVIKNTLAHIDPLATMDQLYSRIDIQDPKIYKLICDQKTDGVFQLESDMFKGMASDIQPENIDDVIVMNALGRPGPLKSGMPQTYARRKRGDEETTEMLHDTADIMDKTYGVIAYQEQFMQVFVRVAGFNANQSDSLARKITAKKKKELMEMLRRMFIYGKVNAEGPTGWEENAKAPWYDAKAKHGTPIKGGVNNGYEEQSLINFWNDIQAFAEYSFNKSHSACYAYIGIVTAWLKAYYPVEFMAALLSSESETADIKRYINVAEDMGITVSVPDINLSVENFMPLPATNQIYYGLQAVKGVGLKSIPAILNARPFVNLKDALERLPKKVFDKTVGRRLIMAGAFDFEEPNRVVLLNRFAVLRRDKDELLNEANWDDDRIIDFEQEALGLPVTVKPWWDQIKAGESVLAPMTIHSIREKEDKNGKLMAFVDGVINKCKVSAIVFSSVYLKSAGMLDPKVNRTATVAGRKDSKGTLKISSVKGSVAEQQKKTPRIQIGRMRL